MLETSKDILNLVLAASIGLFALFLIWLLWYVISMLRNVRKITIGIRTKMETVDKILDLVKDKLEKGSNHMGLIADSVIKLVGLMAEKQGKNADKKKTKKKK